MSKLSSVPSSFLHRYTSVPPSMKVTIHPYKGDGHLYVDKILDFCSSILVIEYVEY